MTILALYLVLGALAGLLAGLFGIGGGLIIVPALVLAFEYQQISPAVLTHMAVGTSLATIILTSLSSIRSHHLKGAVEWHIVPPMAVGLVVGALAGGQTAHLIGGPQLQILIGGGAILIAARMALAGPPKATRSLPARPLLALVGAGIGWVSAIFGIGGGSLSVPFLTRCNLLMQHAVGTAAALGLPIAVAGALGHAWAGWGQEALPPWSSGYVYWPAFIGIVATSVWAARIGARIAHDLPAPVLKRIFAALLLLVGLRMVLSNL